MQIWRAYNTDKAKFQFVGRKRQFVKFSIDHQKLLLGVYEAERVPLNWLKEGPVPDFAFNILNSIGCLYRPILDEIYLSRHHQTPQWPDGKTFAVCLTHDVDDVSLFSLRQSLRSLKSPFIGMHSTHEKIKRISNLVVIALQSLRSPFLTDPLHCYERWLEIEASYRAKSTFFFWPGWKSVTRHHFKDPTYELNDRVCFDGIGCTVTEMIREIDRRGWEIGLHPSWYSYNDADELKNQKDALENALGHSVHSIRQHCLHYDIRITPLAHATAGFKYDSTLGFNNNIGFRFGTCYPWRLYDLDSDNELPILEIPLVVQDVAMLNPSKGMSIDPNMAFHYIDLIGEEVEKVGGVLTLLWHPNEIMNPESWNLYKRVLNHLNQKNAWITSLQEVGDWWLR